MKGDPFSRKRLAAVTVLAICISDSTPSCTLAPPPVTNATNGKSRRAAVSNAVATFSPTTLPMLPPINPKSNTTSITSMPSIRQRPITAASVNPVRFWSREINFWYGFRLLKDNGDTELRYLWDSLNVRLSANNSTRCLADKV